MQVFRHARVAEPEVEHIGKSFHRQFLHIQPAYSNALGAGLHDHYKMTEIIKMEYYLLNVFFNLLIFFYHRMVNRKVWIECFVCIRSEFSIFQGLTRVVRMCPGRFVLVSTSDVYG